MKTGKIDLKNQGVYVYAISANFSYKDRKFSVPEAQTIFETLMEEGI